MDKKIHLCFDSGWVMSRKDKDKLPVDVFIKAMQKAFDIEILNNSLIECLLIIKNSEKDLQELSEIVDDIITKAFGISDVIEIANYCITEEPECILEIKEEPFVDIVEEQIDKINALVGADEFKALANECVKMAPVLNRRNLSEILKKQCYVFSIDDGNGLTTYLEMFAKLLNSLGLFDYGPNSVVEIKIPPLSREEGPSPFSAVNSHLKHLSNGPNRIIAIDISEWMSNIRHKKFREFLTSIEDRAGNNIFVFRVPFVEKEVLSNICQGIGDVLFVRAVSFVPFEQNDLIKAAEKILSNKGFTVEEDAWEVFNLRICEEKSDGRFYGINTVNKVINEMLYIKLLHNVSNGIEDFTVKKNEILKLASTFDSVEGTGIDMLDSYIGMESVKQRVMEIVAQIELSLKRKDIGSPCIHMRFVGNPGTGKTTVARVIGKVLKEKGILRNGSFFEYAGRDFCGKYIGSTAPKTAGICRDAYGSVLFIDEAYTLYKGDGMSEHDYGKEAIDTLIAEMENHRSDLVVIMAGYPDEMDTLMKANAGLESRMPYIIEFPNYTREQLYEIFMQMVEKHFEYSEGLKNAVKEYFNSLPDSVVLSKEFSNARFVRNLFERTWCKTVMRSQLNKKDTLVISKEDFLLAISDKEFTKLMVKPISRRGLGFI